MSRPPAKPQFVARHSYRQRRLRDVARVLPVVGTVLWFLPLLYLGGPEAAGTGPVLILVFAVWAGLIIVAYLVSGAGVDDQEGETPPEGR